METKKEFKVKDGHVLVLRTNDKNNRSRKGFQYPQSGWVEAPDWELTPECGNGLHGALKGCGDGTLFDWSDEALWVVLEVEEAGIIPLDGLIKFKGGTVVYVGDRLTATELIASVYGHIGIIGAIVRLGIGEKAIGGDYAVIIGGKLTYMKAGNFSLIVGGDETIVAGLDWSKVMGGNGSVVMGGNGSIVIGGNESLLYGGLYSGVVGGDNSIVKGGVGSSVRGGNGSVLSLDYYDANEDTYKPVKGYVGKDGILPDTTYVLNEDNKFVELFY